MTVPPSSFEAEILPERIRTGQYFWSERDCPVFANQFPIQGADEPEILSKNLGTGNTYDLRLNSTLTAKSYIRNLHKWVLCRRGAVAAVAVCAHRHHCHQGCSPRCTAVLPVQSIIRALASVATSNGRAFTRALSN